MAYTTLAALNKIIQYDPVLVPDPEIMITSAHTMVVSIIGDALDPVADLAVLELVERYLAAHLISISDARTASEQVKSLQQSYQYKLSLGLGTSHYGQLAMLLDTSKKLSSWNHDVVNGFITFSLFWGGKTPVSEAYIP